MALSEFFLPHRPMSRPNRRLMILPMIRLIAFVAALSALMIPRYCGKDSRDNFRVGKDLSR
jgi:hypothetical protein